FCVSTSLDTSVSNV
ncbi:hypothetical protein D046_1266B, partial [Vibrio parahaemolyticus V-223/04]